MRSEYTKTLSEIYEAELFLSDNAKISLSDMQQLSWLDFDLYYMKTVEKIKERKDRLQEDRHQKNFF